MIDEEKNDTRARESLERQRAALALHELAELLEERQSTFPEAEAARALFLAAGVELTPAARPL